jgi:glucodextranase-like protein
MSRWLNAGVALIFGAISLCARADVWVSDKSNVYKVDPATAQIVLILPSAKTLALAVSPLDGSVWVLSDVALVKRSKQGAQLASIDLAAIGLDNSTALALDGRDDSVWLAEGGGAIQGQSKSIAHIDATGSVLQKIVSPGGVLGLRVAIDQSAWVLGRSSVYHYSRSGTLLSTVNLSPLVSGEPKLLAVDSISAWILVAGEKRVLRVDANGASSTPVLSALPASADALAFDEAYGTYYVLAGAAVYPIPSATGVPSRPKDLSAFGIANATTLAFDPQSEGIFIGHAAGVARLDRSLAAANLARTSSAVQVVGVAPLVLSSSVSILSPADGAVTNRATPPIGIAVNASCSGNPCGFGAAYYGTYGFDAQLNGSSIGSRFSAGADPDRFDYVPAAPLPEGVNLLVAGATDAFGQSTPQVTSRFVVDTIPPGFVSLTPASGSYTNQNPVLINGRLSEPASLTIGVQPVIVNADGSFSASQALAEGANGFQLVARDLAGNAGAAGLTITLDTVPPALSNVSPASGATVSAASILLSGNVSEPATVTIERNGVIGRVDSQAFSFAVSLSPGPNDFTLTAVDRAGNRTSLALRYTLAGSLSVSIGSPAPGASLASSKAVVTGTVSADKPVGIRVNDVPATVVGKQFAAQIDLAPGPGVITATATTADGASATTSVTVTVPTTNQPEPRLSAVAGIAPFTLRIDMPRGYFGALDYDGNGTYDDFFFGGGQGSHTYTAAGIYTITALISDNVNTYTVTRTIVVQSVADLDQLVRASFNGMLECLRASDLDGAMQFFTPAARVKYRPVFEQLAGSLATVPDQIGTIVDGFLTGELAEYLLVQNRPTGKQGFLIYLQKGPDGVWRIAQL